MNLIHSSLISKNCLIISMFNVLQGEVLFIANVGDSRAVLATTCDDGNLVPVQLTVDFKPNLPREYIIYAISWLYESPMYIVASI